MSRLLDRAANRFYATSAAYRAGDVHLDVARAETYYRRYIAFVTRRLENSGKLLDLGCGTGLSTYHFARLGYKVVGLDLCYRFFQTTLQPDAAQFVGGDVVSLPFTDASFDAVASYQMLEHVPQPVRALDEMIRVLRPGGLVFIAGPNLFSPIPAVIALLYSIPRTRPFRYWFLRDPEYPRYPAGVTYPEAISSVVKNLWRVVMKSLRKEPSMLMREPDFREPVHADSDACFFLNPIDVAKYFRRKGLTVLTTRGTGRLGLLGPLAGGTWVAARKESGADVRLPNV